MAILCTSTLFATKYNLDYSLFTVSPTLSNSGTNTICLPYVLPAGLANASDLMDKLNGASTGGNAVVSISKFVASTDLLQTYTGTVSSNDFLLVAGKGYRVQVSETFGYEITGSDDDALSIELLAQGPPDSASGTSDYCPPFNRVSDKASDLMAEINKATPNSFINVSKFLIATDLLQTYDGIDPANDFDLRSGESYRVRVSSDVNFVPDVYEIAVNVEIEGRPPAPCGVNDGGVLAISNVGVENDVRVKWHGGDPEREEPPDAGGPYTNLVFLPTKPPDMCVESGGCVDTCPGDSTSAGCERIDCNICGCEITDGMMGICNDLGGYTRCNDDSDCAPFLCEIKGILAPGMRNTLSCNQTHCIPNNTTPPDPQEPPFCPDIDDVTMGTNCCDQQFADTDNCLDPSLLKCTELIPGSRFLVSDVSIDGQNWINLEDRGIVPDSVKETNCCDFVCVDLSDPGNSTCSLGCTLGSCSMGQTCISSCEGTCSENPTQACSSILKCTAGATDTCERPCQGS